MYQSKLTMKETQKAIKIVKDTFERKLASAFNLDRVSAPLVVFSQDKINDDLGLVDSAVKFKAANFKDDLEIVQSLAKWKRMALKKYNYLVGEGLYTDMNAIRPQDVVDNTHSLYVDQWDWELVITRENRTKEFLRNTVKTIVKLLNETKQELKEEFPILNNHFNDEVFFISFDELKRKYPNLTLEEREREITKKHLTVFIEGIGYEPDEVGNILRAPDYDDWHLNGDILIWSYLLDDAVEITSMGIRVDEISLLNQLKLANRLDLIDSKYHQMVLNQSLPLTIGGGIGQSRICMLLLEKKHIAEVQASVWNEEELKYFKENKINYL